jgi:putative membrane protein
MIGLRRRSSIPEVLVIDPESHSVPDTPRRGSMTIEWSLFGFCFYPTRTNLALAFVSPRFRGKEFCAMTTLFAFLHHLCAFTLVSAVAIEFVLIRSELTLASARRLQITDMVLGVAAGLLLIIGLSRVFFFEKGADYYFHSHAFLTKFSVFIVIGLVSIIPTVEFLSWNKPRRAGQVPAISARKLRLVTAVIHGELAGIAIILLCAAIMARGGWV